MKKDKKVMNENQGSKGPYMVFYVLSVLLLIYMLFSLVTSYQNFVQYCDTYGVSPTEVWFTGFQSILAAAVPCVVYAATMYGIGYLIKRSHVQ